MPDRRTLPALTHLQFLVLGVLRQDEQPGRVVRQALASYGVRRTAPAFYQLMSRLESAGLVTERMEGRFRYYRLRAQPLAEVGTWLNRYRAHLERQLDALGAVLDEMPEEPDDPPREAPKPRGSRGGRT